MATPATGCENFVGMHKCCRPSRHAPFGLGARNPRIDRVGHDNMARDVVLLLQSIMRSLEHV